MKLTENTITILNHFRTINDSVRIQEGNVIRTCSNERTIFSISSLDMKFPREFCIYELHKFLSLYSMLEEPDLEFEQTHVKMKSGNTTIHYRFADPKTIVFPKSDLPDFNVVTSFSITKKEFNSIMKAANVLGSDYIGIIAEDGNIIIRAFDMKDSGKERFEYIVGKTHLPNFKANMAKDNVKLIADDYTVTVKDKAVEFSSEIVSCSIVLDMTSEM